MESEHKVLDTFQIVGFAISIVISVALIATKQDTIPSVTLGVVLAIITQLFDLQFRLNSSEQKLLQANILTKSLYHNQWLLSRIQEIVEDYFKVKGGQFDLFKRRADNTIELCRDTLHSMAEGYTTVELQSPFSISSEVTNATKSIKASSVADINYWRSTHAQKYIDANAQAVQRGINFTRIFINSPQVLEKNLDILEKQHSLGIKIYVAYLEEIPSALNDDYLIIDDRIFARLELTGHGQAREERISVEPVEVEQMIRKFDALLRYSRSYEQVINELKPKE